MDSGLDRVFADHAPFPLILKSLVTWAKATDGVFVNHNVNGGNYEHDIEAQ